MALKKEQIQSISLWRNPMVFTRTALIVLFELILSCITWVFDHKLRSGAVLLALAGSAYGLEETTTAGTEFAPWRHVIVDYGSFVVYWVLLGVMSSIGLGSGLHTFVLFLGPHIAKVAEVAILNNNTDFTAKIDKYFSAPATYSMEEMAQALTPKYDVDAFITTASAPEARPDYFFFHILRKVSFAAFLWGLGTAIGELPPYFIARAAKKSGEALEELEEVDELESSKGGKKKASAMERAKMVVFESVQRYGFAAILLAASIPNPLFDLAGLTCGHFGIPFWTFFGATFIGKAIVKVSIQVFFIIALVQYGQTFVEYLAAMTAGSFLDAPVRQLEKSVMAVKISSCALGNDRRTCCELWNDAGKTRACIDAQDAGDSLVKQAWEGVILLMIAYFLYSMVASGVHEYLVREVTREHEAASHQKIKHHETHVHGSQVMTAIINADDLGLSSLKPTPRRRASSVKPARASKEEGPETTSSMTPSVQRRVASKAIPGKSPVRSAEKASPLPSPRRASPSPAKVQPKDKASPTPARKAPRTRTSQAAAPAAAEGKKRSVKPTTRAAAHGLRLRKSPSRSPSVARNRSRATTPSRRR